MKKRLHDKKAGIAILLSLIIISLADIVFRAVAIDGLDYTKIVFDEQLTTIVFAAIILFFNIKGKDRVCYILYGALAGYFILNELFELPGFISTVVSQAPAAGEMNILSVVSPAAHIIAICGIITIGVFLVEYMNDGTIHNKAFNGVCIVTVIAHLAFACFVIFDIITKGNPNTVLALFSIASSITMVFMFTFFAYDSAKAQLKKTDLTK